MINFDIILVLYYKVSIQLIIKVNAFLNWFTDFYYYFLGLLLINSDSKVYQKLWLIINIFIWII